MMRATIMRRLVSWRLVRSMTIIGLFLAFLEVFSIRFNLTYQPGLESAHFRNERVFIASIHWNNEYVLKNHWTPALLQLVQEMGIGNVFVSIQESGSFDDSRSVIEQLDAKLGELGVRKNVVLESTTHEDEVNREPAGSGWIQTPRGKTELRRIPYLARLRNTVMEPLHKLKESGVTFDRILLLNDVVFTVADVRNLLSSRNGDYAAVCSMDFSKPPKFYDTFALRDWDGYEAVMMTWPYFRSKTSRHALQSNSIVPVQSCWNGMVAMDAAPFYDHNLQFRGISDSLALQHLEGSECCLIHKDNPISASKGVWINPAVRVGYNESAYHTVTDDFYWPPTMDRVKGVWENRLRRWLTTSWFQDRVVRQRLQAWKGEDKQHHEPGGVCLIDEMQVLIWNGWAHL